MNPYRIIQITDTHIGPTEDFELYGPRPYPALVKLVDELNSLPFVPDLILHTGDVVDDGAEASYRLAAPVLSRLKAPVQYVLGNHDDATWIQSILMQRPPTTDRLDTMRMLNDDVQLITLDSVGPNPPAGQLLESQISNLKSLCSADGPAIVIALHHSPLLLDTPWLDFGGKSWGGKTMLLENHEQFRAAIAPARERIRAVIFGHVHGSFTVQQDGILYVACQSGFAGLRNFPNDEEAILDVQQSPGYNIITLTDESIIVKHRTLRI